MISNKALQEYKEIQKAERGVELSDSEAMDEATSLLTLMNAIYRPVKKEWLKQLEQNDYDIRTNRKITGQQKTS